MPLLLVLLTLGACAPASSRSPAPSSPAATGAASPASASPASSGLPSTVPQVTVIVMENKAYDAALAPPYTASLAARFAVATDYHAVSHPSLPNYLAITSGSTWGITDDGYHQLPATGIGNQLTSLGVPWHAYMEGMSAGCRDSSRPYALKHNPFAYYGTTCPANVTSAASLTTDLAQGAAGLLWITPDLCNDTHDCSTSTGDAWLARTVPEVLASPGWRAGGVLFIVWDEDDGGGGNRVPLIVVSPRVAAHSLSGTFDHFSLLATIEDLLHVPRLLRAAGANPLPVTGP